jgi:hypothetical protein
MDVNCLTGRVTIRRKEVLSIRRASICLNMLHIFKTCIKNIVGRGLKKCSG